VQSSCHSPTTRAGRNRTTLAGADVTMTSPTTPEVTCLMSGGPQDGNRYTFDFLPELIGVQDPPGGVYALTETVTQDGAHLFGYRGKDDEPPLTPAEEAEVEEMMRAMYGDQYQPPG
jgi:hypothetical protein